MKISYNHCGLCGYTPHDDLDEPNYAPLRSVFYRRNGRTGKGTLCRACRSEIRNRKPQEDDFAFMRTNGEMDDSNTD